MKNAYMICALAFLFSGLVGCAQSSSLGGPVMPPAQNPGPAQTNANRAPALPQKAHKPLVLSNILRDNYGFPLCVSHDKAEALCQQRGGTLPSARDFAEFAIANGSRGVKETAYPNGAAKELENAEIRKMANDDHDVIYRFEPPLQRIDFYFNHKGYKSTATGDAKYRRYWTSDRAPLPAKPEVSFYYYTFIDGLGEIFPEPIDDMIDVTICVLK